VWAESIVLLWQDETLLGFFASLRMTVFDRMSEFCTLPSVSFATLGHPVAVDTSSLPHLKSEMWCTRFELCLD